MVLHFLMDAGGAGLSDAGGETAAPTEARVGELVAITGAEAHHAAVVRRVRVGEEVTVGDGRGLWLTGDVEEAAPRRVAVRVTARTAHAAASPRLVLVQALAKGDRDELAIQAATELGVDEVVPWQASRSVSRWSGPKIDKGIARWTSIVREAAKQAHRAWLPQVTPPATTAQVAARATKALVLVLEPTASVALTAVPLDDAPEIVLIVGPEGGVAAEELSTLADAGATAVRLGETVLRTSTAGPAALAVLNARLRRW